MACDSRQALRGRGCGAVLAGSAELAGVVSGVAESPVNGLA